MRALVALSLRDLEEIDGRVGHCRRSHDLDSSRRRLKPIEIRKSKYLNNRIEQDHRRIKRRIRTMLGFKSPASAAIILTRIEMVHMTRKRPARYAFNPKPSLAEQFAILAAQLASGQAFLRHSAVATKPFFIAAPYDLDA